MRKYECRPKRSSHDWAQWCVNNDLDPLEVYYKAYPVSLYHTIDTVLSSCKQLNSTLQNKMNNLENQLKKAGWSL